MLSKLTSSFQFSKHLTKSLKCTLPTLIKPLTTTLYPSIYHISNRYLSSVATSQQQQLQDEDLVHFQVNGKEITSEKDLTILEACRKNNIHIPSLCWHPDLCVGGNCRLCLVEYKSNIDGELPYDKKLLHACATKVQDNISIRTNTPKVRDNIKQQLRFMKLSHNGECMTCIVNGKCELQDLCYRYDVHSNEFDTLDKAAEFGSYDRAHDYTSPIDSKNAIVMEPDKCILCNRCVRTCSELQGMCILGTKLRGGQSKISTFGDLSLDDTTCLQCGQCTLHCPVGALHERDEVHDVMDLLDNNLDKKKVLCISFAPSVRVTVGEEFGDEPGTINVSQMISAARELGFDYVFDTNFTADLTILEEGTEFINRLNNNSKNNTLPMFTSCCPAWINMVEKLYPQFIDNLSSCRSPQGMMGSLLKHYMYDKSNFGLNGYKKEDVINISVMPCVAKKEEKSREQLLNDVDYVLTTREFGRLCKNFGIHWNSLPKDNSIKFDSILGESSGAAILFGTTGGVMEAALRTAYEIVTKKTLPKLEFEDVRGLEGVKEATVMLDDIELKVAVVHQGREIRDFLDSGAYKNYHFIEFMMCKGGCIGGGGQPKSLDPDILLKRQQSIYKLDNDIKIRKSHENKEVLQLYEDYLGEPNSHKAHELLHTHYQDKSHDVIGR